jgi:AbiU2
MSTLAQATQLPPLDIGKALYELFNEVIIGTAYLSMAKSLAAASKTHPIITRVSPHFFGMTINAHLESAQLYGAKLFDEHDDCASIPWLLKQAKNRPNEFKNRPCSQLDSAIRESEQVCAAKASVLMALKHRRDRWLAHLDRKTIRDPVQFSQDARLTYPELEDLFDAATHVLNLMADLHGVPGFLIGGDDYDDFSRTLELIEKGVQANARELEERIGPCPEFSEDK